MVVFSLLYQRVCNLHNVHIYYTLGSHRVLSFLKYFKQTFTSIFLIGQFMLVFFNILLLNVKNHEAPNEHLNPRNIQRLKPVKYVGILRKHRVPEVGCQIGTQLSCQQKRLYVSYFGIVYFFTENCNHGNLFYSFFHQVRRFVCFMKNITKIYRKRFRMKSQILHHKMRMNSKILQDKKRIKCKISA